MNNIHSWTFTTKFWRTRCGKPLPQQDAERTGSEHARRRAAGRAATEDASMEKRILTKTFDNGGRHERGILPAAAWALNQLDSCLFILSCEKDTKI